MFYMPLWSQDKEHTSINVVSKHRPDINNPVPAWVKTNYVQKTIIISATSRFTVKQNYKALICNLDFFFENKSIFSGSSM